MRVGVIHDTTSFKDIRIQRGWINPGAGDATEHVVEGCDAGLVGQQVFEIKMLQVVIQQAVRQTMWMGTCLERVMQMLMEFLAIPVP